MLRLETNPHLAQQTTMRSLPISESRVRLGIVTPRRLCFDNPRRGSAHKSFAALRLICSAGSSHQGIFDCSLSGTISAFSVKVCAQQPIKDKGELIKGFSQMDDQHEKPIILCRVCGFPSLKARSLKDRRCSCCGIHQGVEDQSEVSVKLWRNKWLRLGAVRQDKSRDE